MEQITLNFEAGLVESYPTCREFVAHRVHNQGRAQKTIAGDMDYSPSMLTRKCAQSPDDSARFTLDDLELFIDVTGDTTAVLYLVEKYLVGENRLDKLKAEVDRLQAIEDAKGAVPKAVA